MLQEAARPVWSIAPTKSLGEDSPKIYVACLAAYNNGILHGRWIDCTFGIDHVWSEIKTILEKSPENTLDYPCEEWAIHDHENFPEGLISEYMDIERVVDYAEMFQTPDGYAILKLQEYFRFDDFQEAKDYHENNFAGEWDSFTEYTENYIEDTGMLSGLPDFAQTYFDVERFANDLEHDFITLEGERGICVYHNN
jgi:antirestriction protein